jgi:hypothetical protein
MHVVKVKTKHKNKPVVKVKMLPSPLVWHFDILEHSKDFRRTPKI